MKPKERRADAEIPTSTLADVAFLLVIFFVITQTFAANQGLDFSMPETPDSQVIDPVESILVEIRPDSSLWVDKRATTPDDLLIYLGQKLRANPDKPVILRPDDEAPYGAMVTTYELLRVAPERLGLEHPIHIALPTRAEASQFWQ